MTVIMKRLLLYLSIFYSVISFISCGINVTGDTQPFDDGLSSDASLSNLQLSDGELNYPFNPHDWIYYASVTNDVESITVRPTASHIRAVIMVNDTEIASGSSSSPINLTEGSENVVNIIVTAENGTSWEYTVFITRFTDAYNNAELSN